MSVFISWAGADREVKNVITAKLREENIEYFDSDEFCQTDFSQECIRNIRRSSVFIVIVSDASMDPRSYVFNEVVEAHRLEGEGALNILVYKVTDSPYTERFAFNLNHISDANHVARTQRSGVSGIDSLIKRTKSLLQRRLEGNPEKPYDVNTPKLVGTPVSYTKYFVDGSRDETLQKIDEALLRSNVVILSEIFGFGKKSVVKKYVQSHPGLSAVEIQGRHDSLREFFLADLHFSNVNELAFDKKEDKDIILKKFEFLKKLEEKDVLIISDVDVEENEDELICSLLAELKCRVIIITQSSAEAYADTFPVITVGKMANQHLFELFFHYYRCANAQEQELLIPHLEGFFDDIGGHTKTIELTATVLYKEMRATPEQVIDYLSSNTDDNRGFKDKIFDTIGELLAIESFTEDEKKTLLLISLMANPVIEEKVLRDLMFECDIVDFTAINALDDNRWITYDSNEKTIYIEPLIAKICARKFAANEDEILWVCFRYFQGIFVSKDFYISSIREQLFFMAHAENFFNLLGFDAISGVVRETRSQIFSQVRDFERISAACQAFSDRYNDVLLSDNTEDVPDTDDEYYFVYDNEDGIENNAEDPIEDNVEYDLSDGEIDCKYDFEISVAQWIHAFFFMSLKAIENMPALYTFSTGSSTSLEDIKHLLISKDVELAIAETIGDETFSKVVANLNYSDNEEDIGYLFTLLFTSVIYAFYEKDFDTMQKKSEELWEFLQDNPKMLDDSEICNMSIILIRLLNTAYIQSSAYQAGAAFYEKILLIEWPDDIKYRLFLCYADLLLMINNEEELALSVLTAAEELFDDAMAKRNAGDGDREAAKLELSIYYAIAFVKMEQLDAAIEKYNEIKEFNNLSVYTNSIINLINSIADGLMALNMDSAVSFISENRPLIMAYMEREDTSEDTKSDLSGLLLVQDMYENKDAESFSAGGVVTDENYYQKYSKDKKNNIFSMMAYNRIAEKVKRYDFSSCTNEELAERSRELFARANAGESRTNIMPEAFALVSEAGFRVLGYRHHQVQYVGAAAMLDGKIAEILNGEGKTYTITLVAYVNSLYSSKSLVIDNSKYLTKRNYNWMRGVYELLGVEVGYMPSQLDRSVLLEKSNAKIVYTDIVSFAFSILYNEKSETEKLLDISAFSAVIDEADNTLIEAAKSVFLITDDPKNTVDYAKKCLKAYSVACKIKGNDRFYETNKFGGVLLNRDIRPIIEEEFNVDYENLAQTNEIKSIEENVKLALYCITLVKNKDFFVKNEIIYRENSTTGELYVVRNETGLFIALANKMPADAYVSKLCKKPSVWNSNYFYGIFSKLGRLCGTSATVCSFKKEFKDIYGIEVVAIPTVLPIRRIDQTVGLYVSRNDKNFDIVDMISEKYRTGQPVLLIVEDIKESDEFSEMLSSYGIEHVVINGLNAENSPEIFASAGTFGSVVIATQLANRGIDIKLGGDAQRMTIFDLVENGIDVSDIDQIMYKLPTQEIRSSELYRNYSAFYERNKAIVAENKIKVLEAGGLCVISTTAYSDMRVEQQIRGRAGRQGDVGESYVFLSMEDKVFSGIFSMWKTNEFWANLIQGTKTVEHPMLKRRIESFKFNVHHRTFREMKNATVLCKRIEQSKNEIFKLKYGIADGSVTFDDLIRIWSQDEDNVNSVREIVKGTAQKAILSVSRLCEGSIDLFTGIDEKKIKERLFEIARLYVSECATDDNEKKKAFVAEASKLLSMHLTDMRDAEEMYGATDIKNSNKFFEDMYAKNLSKQITAAIDRWLMNL